MHAADHFSYSNLLLRYEFKVLFSINVYKEFFFLNFTTQTSVNVHDFHWPFFLNSFACIFSNKNSLFNAWLQLTTIVLYRKSSKLIRILQTVFSKSNKLFHVIFLWKLYTIETPVISTESETKCVYKVNLVSHHNI